MTVYVDAAIHRRAGAKTERAVLWCHMLSLDIPALHAMARRIGISEHRLDRRPVVHYDLTAAERERAIEAGAIAASRAEIVAVMRALRGTRK